MHDRWNKAAADHRQLPRQRRLFRGSEVNCFEPNTLPNDYSIVVCRFPYGGNFAPGPEPKPALVVRSSANRDGSPCLYVVYCTSRIKLEREEDLNIVTGWKECGFKAPTRIDMGSRDRNRRWLPWCEEYFPGAKVCGSLTPHQIRELQKRW